MYNFNNKQHRISQLFDCIAFFKILPMIFFTFKFCVLYIPVYIIYTLINEYYFANRIILPVDISAFKMGRERNEVKFSWTGKNRNYSE